MKYVGDIYRPPSEAYSLLIQITIGCSHNKCTFCSMFKEKNFRLRDMDEILEEIKTAGKMYHGVEKIFLCDGDALCLSTDKLVKILDTIKDSFKYPVRVGIYGSSKDILRKSKEELVLLKEKGLGIVYIGAESGSDKVLERINKGVTSKEIIESVRAVEEAGIKASVTFISGIGGLELWEEHALKTGEMITEMNSSYVSLLTLMLDPSTPLYEEIERGEFTLLSKEKVLEETYLMLSNANPTQVCIFRSNHASNYLSLRGNLPQDKERLLKEIQVAMDNTQLLKDERFRRL